MACHVAQAEIETLPGHRMHRVRGVADEREALAHLFFHARERQRIGGALAEAREGPEPVAETVLQLIQEFRVAPAEDGLHLGLFRAPHHGTFIFTQRQQGQRAGVGEAFVRRVAVGLTRRDRGHDGALAVFGALGLDPQGRAHRGMRAVGGDDQARRERFVWHRRDAPLPTPWPDRA